MKPKLITFTGFDDNTSIEEMKALSEAYPIEWGILFSPSRQGIDNRYPTRTAVRRLMQHHERGDLQVAAHLCGDYSRAIMNGDLPDGLPVNLDDFDRIQINHADPIPKVVAEFADKYTGRVILQSRITDGWPIRWPHFDYLYDRSGGRGETPKAWPPHPGYYVGYAGGIGPDNVLGVNYTIDSANAYWIDMESGVRTDDRFDLAKCRAVCEAVLGRRE